MKALTLQLARQLQLFLLQAADPPLVGLRGQAVLQAALDLQVQLVLAHLSWVHRQLSQAPPVRQGAEGGEEQPLMVSPSSRRWTLTERKYKKGGERKQGRRVNDRQMKENGGERERERGEEGEREEVAIITEA